MSRKTSYNDYKQALRRRFIAYRQKHYPLESELFDPQREHVFKPEFAFCNLFDGKLDQLLPPERRHRWFRSMGSSQALTVSVLGTLMRRGDLSLLAEVPDEDGRPLLPGFDAAGEAMFDYHAITLNEPRPTQVDLFLRGRNGHVAIECKLGEGELGPCSQVATLQCTGDYAHQPGRSAGQRCALTEKGIGYWTYIPHLFHWQAGEDHTPCPIWKPYQLVRNILAAAIDPDRKEIWGHPVAILIGDANNPAFAPGGRIDEQFRAVQTALRQPATLKRTTWQLIVKMLQGHQGYEALIAWLGEKYGIEA